MKKEFIYCVYCGDRNKIGNKKCSGCHKKLDPKTNDLLEYLKSKVRDDLKGNVKDNVFSVITSYIKSHLYGAILTCSIVASVVSVVVNASTNNSYIERVSEKPVVVSTTSYLGEGLSSLDVAKKYVKAVEENDINTIKGLQLESFHKDVYEEIKNKTYSSVSGDVVNSIFNHELVENHSIFFKNNKINTYVGNSELVMPSGKYGDYTFNRFIIVMSYCYSNSCRIVNGEEIQDFTARVQVELIEVDGNYYVNGENMATYMGVDEIIMYGLLVKYEGDTSKLSKEKVDEYLNMTDEELQELGILN